jgi:zinc protease
MPLSKNDFSVVPSKLPGAAGLLLLLSLVCFLALARPAHRVPVTFQELSAGRLDNGVRFVVANRPNADHRIVVALNLQVGAQDERPEESGISHYLEHMAFNGAGEFGPKDIDQWLRSEGLSTGQDDNASTGNSETVYQLSIPDNSPEALGHALRFLAAIASQMRLDPALIEKERPIILGEMQLRHTPDQDAYVALQHFTSDGRTLSTPVIGTPQTVNSFHREELADYYHRMYRPERATIEVVGKTNPVEIEEKIRTAFGNWTAASPPPTAANAAVNSANEFKVITIPQVSFPYLALSRLEASDRSRPEQEFENDLYSRMFSVVFEHRLETLIERGDLPGANSSVDSGPTLRRFFKTDILLAVSTENWRETLGRAWLELRGLREEAIGVDELNRATEKVGQDLQGDVASFLASPSNARESQLRFTLRSADGIIDPARRQILATAALQKITPATFQAWIQRHTPATGWRIALVIPPGASSQPAPHETDLAAAISATQRLTLQPWHEDTSIVTLLRHDPPRPALPPSSTTDTDLQVTTTHLSNQVRVHYRKMEACGNEVTICLSLDGGEIEETNDNRGITQLAASALRSATTKDFTSLQMNDWLRAHGMTWDVSTERTSVLLRLHAPAAEVENAFRFLHVILTESVLKPNVLERWKNEMGLSLSRESRDPIMISAARVQSRLFGGDSRVASIPVSQLTRLTCGQGQEWLDHLRQHCVIEAGVTANLPSEKIGEMTARYLGSLPDHPHANTEIRPLSGPLATGPTLEQCNITNNRAAATITFRSASLNNLRDFYGLQLISRMLQYRLFNEVREKLGMAYFVNCQAEPGLALHDGGFFLVSFSSSNEKVSAGVAACQSVLRDFIARGPTDDEIATTLKQTLMGLQQIESSPEHWAWSLSQLQVNGVSLELMKQRPNDFRREATREEIMRLAREYLTAEREFTAIAKQLLPAE